MSLKNSYVETAHSVMVLGGRAFGRHLELDYEVI